MTAFVRIASGSLATGSRVGITLVSQLALVPIYLSFWSPETYGIWLALQTFYALGTIFGMAHLTFLENEFIRIWCRRHPGAGAHPVVGGTDCSSYCRCPAHRRHRVMEDGPARSSAGPEHGRG